MCPASDRGVETGRQWAGRSSGADWRSAETARRRRRPLQQVSSVRLLMGLLQLRYEHDSSTIRVRFECDTTSYEELCAFEQ